MFGLADTAFIRGKAPMTKREIRALSLLALDLTPEALVIDIGAGTGSVAVEAARYACKGQVYAVEKDPENVALIHENIQHFGLENLQVISGSAPESLETCLAEVIADAVFVGGSGGSLDAILDWAWAHLKPGGRLVMNTVTIENSATATLWYKKRCACGHMTDFNLSQVQVSRGRFVGSVTLMEAQNPVIIFSAVKESR